MPRIRALVNHNGTENADRNHAHPQHRGEIGRIERQPRLGQAERQAGTASTAGQDHRTGGEGEPAQGQIAMAGEPVSAAREYQIQATIEPSTRISPPRGPLPEAADPRSWPGRRPAIASTMPASDQWAGRRPSIAQAISAEISGMVVLMMPTVTASVRVWPRTTSRHGRRDAERRPEGTRRAAGPCTVPGAWPRARPGAG